MKEDAISTTEEINENPETTLGGEAMVPAVGTTGEVSLKAVKTRERGVHRGRMSSRRRGGKREERARSEYDNKIISIRRVARVVAGGRRFNFSVALVVGNRRGMVGVGTGKAGDTALAIEKATRSAKRAMIRIPLTKEMRIPHEVSAKYSASEVKIVPVSGRGMVAGSSLRVILELGGVKDVTAKILSRSKNQLNNARATIEALKKLKG